MYSAALCRGLIEAGECSPRSRPVTTSIPRLYAAASLKHRLAVGRERGDVAEYSAALCRGLIEACPPCARRPAAAPYSAALCRGLIEAER